MVPAPWAREAAARYRGEDVGVHLTLNAEYDLYRWGPITHAPVAARRRRRVPPHGRRRLGPRRPRRGAARAAGPRSSGRSCGASTSATSTRHMGALQLRPEFFDIYLELAVDFGLPMRLPGEVTERADRLPVPPAGRRGGRGVPRPLRATRVRGGSRRRRSSGPCTSCGPASPRCTCTRPSTPPSCAPWRPTGPAGSTTTPSSRPTAICARMLERAGVKLIGYRELRDLMVG